MKDSTRLMFEKLQDQQATAHKTPSTSVEFSVTPSVQQALVDAIVEPSGFLQEINVELVDELEGEKIYGGVSLNPPSRTDTDAGEREPKDILVLTNKKYKLAKTEFDHFVRYITVDTWARKKFSDFVQRYASWSMDARRRAMLMVGWYGESRAAVTNPTTNTKGQDVDKGWFQILRDFNGGSQFYSQGATANEIRIGDGGDFPNLDTAVASLLEMIPDEHLSDDAVTIIGRDLISDEKLRLYAALGQKPTEKEKIESEAITQMYGGLPLKVVPGFPKRGVMITHTKNLSIYNQEGSERRRTEDKPSRDRVNHFVSVNGGYVIEDEKAAAAFEFKNVKIKQGAAWV